MDQRGFAWICTLSALAVGLVAPELPAKLIDGEEYRKVGGVWYIYDANDHPWQIAPSCIHIKFREGVTSTQRDSLATRHELTLLPVKVPEGYYRFEYDLERDPVSVLEGVLASPVVADADLDTYAEFYGSPPDRYYEEFQWNLRIMALERAWDISTGEAPITVALIDMGVTPSHTDLAFNRWENPGETPEDGIDDDNDTAWYGSPLADDTWGWDFTFGDNEPTAFGEHGTTVAGMCCASSGDPWGIASPAGGSPAGNPIRWASISAATSFQIGDAIRYCRFKDIDIVNMSLGFKLGGNPHIITNQLDSLYMRGALLVAAAGFGSAVMPPATHAKVIAVGATDGNDERWWYSPGGEKLELMAPSGDIDFEGSVHVVATDNEPDPTTCIPKGYNDQYEFGLTGCERVDTPCDMYDCEYVFRWGGTSASCATVSGLAALVWSHEPGLSNEELRQLLRHSAKDLGDAGRDDDYGYGRVDAYRAMTKWGTIAQNTTWSNSVWVSGDVVVAEGSTLTIAPGTTIHIASDDNELAGADTTRVEFNVEGFLDVNGTAEDPVIFKSWRGGSTADWVGFYFDSLSAGASFEHCVVKHAEYGIEAWAEVAVDNCVIDSCRWAGIISYRGDLLVEDSELSSPDGWGIYMGSASPYPAVIAGTTVRDCRIAGITVQGGREVVIRRTHVAGNGLGLYAAAGATVEVNDNCVFKHNEIGIKCDGSTPGICGSVIDSNSTAGIWCQYFAGAKIEGNTIMHNGAGVFCQTYADPTVRWNAITHNRIGINTISSASPDLGTPASHGNNQIQYNRSYQVSNLTEGIVIHAEFNFWGVTTPPCAPKASLFYGSVNSESALCSNPLSGATGVGDGENEGLPRSFALGPAVPNPFNPATTIHYEVPSPGGLVVLRVYNVAGQLVRLLASEFKQPGYHTVEWDGRDAHGSPVATSVYFVRMSSGSFTDTRKIVLLK